MAGKVVGGVGRLNWGIITVLCAIAFIGVMMHFSVSEGAWAGMPLTHSMRFMSLLAVAIVLAATPPRWWYEAAYPLYGVVLLLLVGVEVFGETRMGATRWLSIGPLSVQPSEFMKVTIVMALARYYNDLRPDRATTLLWSLPAFLLLCVPVGLVMHQPDLGTGMLIAFAGIAIVFLAGLSWRYIVPALVIAAVGAVAAYQFVLHDYQRARVNVFLGLADDPLGEGYHVLQSKIAIGSAGLFGQGWMQGSQAQLNFLPEKHTDFIFTMIVEEFGLFGGLLVLLLFAMLMGLAISVAARVRSQAPNAYFQKLAVAGVAATLACYVLINTGMVMGLVPVVGIPLPLISYGGTAMTTLMVCFGLVLSIDNHRDSASARRVR
ncbi:MAG: rod shape-determining protein RodA [Hyphomonadaceae bacterium]|nr:rod shape-determining protein RodA [Hyphomonadaceae bacterium]